jgi:hypothetical protein
MTVRAHTHITRVTLYRNGALVTRAASLPAAVLGAEPCEVLLEGLPLLFRSASLRLRSLSPGVVAGPVSEHPELGTVAAVEPEVAPQLEALVAEDRRLLAEEKQRKAQLGAYERLSLSPLPSKPVSRPTSQPSLDGWLALDALALEGQTAAADALAGIAARREELATKRTALQVAARRTPGRLTRTLHTTLHRSEQSEETADIEVEYFVPGARWAPVYQVHVDTRARTARLHVAARVAQATGEDWSAIPLALSTADLTRDATAPRLDSWRIGRYTPPASDWRPLPGDLDALFADFDRAPKAPSTPPPRPTPPRSVSPPSGAVSISDGIVASSREVGAMPPPSMPSPMPSAAPMPSAPKSKKRRGKGRRGRDEGEAASEAEEAPAVFEGPAEAPSDQLLDYAWLRLATAGDRARRGKLLPVTLTSAVADFLEARGGDEGLLSRFKDALRGLEREQARLARASLPSGCTDIRSSSFFHRYPAGPRATLPSDGTFRQVQVARREAGCELLLRAVPRQDAAAFRFARLANPLGQPLLPGPLQVYLDGAFVVTSQLPATGAQEEMVLNLGVEDGVRIARNATFAQSEHGMFSAVSRLEHRVEVEVRSTLSAPIALHLCEQLPTDGGEDGIEVELDEAVPAPRRDIGFSNETTEGALMWSLSLAPGTLQSIRYHYTIDISARKELIGGNRREP